MVTKFSKPVHLEDLTQIKLNQAGASDVIKSRSLDKLKTSSLPDCLWPLNLAGW